MENSTATPLLLCPVPPTLDSPRAITVLPFTGAQGKRMQTQNLCFGPWRVENKTKLVSLSPAGFVFLSPIEKKPCGFSPLDTSWLAYSNTDALCLGTTFVDLASLLLRGRSHSLATNSAHRTHKWGQPLNKLLPSYWSRGSQKSYF